MSMYDRDWYRESLQEQRQAEADKQKRYKIGCWIAFIAIVLIVLMNDRYFKISPVRDAMPNSYASFLNQIDSCKSELIPVAEAISEQHRIPYEARDIGTYRNMLIKGISLCDKAHDSLASLKPPNEFVQLTYLALKDVDNLKMAWSSYLEYSYSNDIENLNVGNSFLEQSNVARKSYQNELVQCLEDCKFRYEILENGIVRYWYSPGLYNDDAEEFVKNIDSSF
ncbi:hypothetical protein SPSYN_02072 [Sporotomaculum syntrophicum]|uniref:Uncharacterized protein n=1 Tax=Sporotomaculum syntrophicum TaxID=182264 RepID=A0A9D3AXD0_9FIRM|nr:hypothetical protein [Sporotomaculum syntrophicum]KAF1084296.1 hypothetical protein SPSYN_02072 [Sporotomaculum syntrophicum]